VVDILVDTRERLWIIDLKLNNKRNLSQLPSGRKNVDFPLFIESTSLYVQQIETINKSYMKHAM
jgi:hypothetical protein